MVQLNDESIRKYVADRASTLARKNIGCPREIHETFTAMSFTKLSGFDLNEYAGVRLPPHAHPRFPHAFQPCLLVRFDTASNSSSPPSPPFLPSPPPLFSSDLPHQP
jgi:hypothetical protein